MSETEDFDLADLILEFLFLSSGTTEEIGIVYF